MPHISLNFPTTASFPRSSDLPSSFTSKPWSRNPLQSSSQLRMAVLTTTVAKSNDVRDAALNLNVKAYEVRRTLAAVWNVQATKAQPPSPESVSSLDMKSEGTKFVVGEDDRMLVDKKDFAPGGKYRCESIKILNSFSTAYVFSQQLSSSPSATSLQSRTNGSWVLAGSLRLTSWSRQAIVATTGAINMGVRMKSKLTSDMTDYSR